MRGVTCSCTSPQRAARAVRTACRVSRAWRRAAPHSPSRGTRRVLTRPGSGARAKTMTTALRLVGVEAGKDLRARDRKSTRLNSSHITISYAVFCLKKKNIRRLVELYLQFRVPLKRAFDVLLPG